MVTPTPEEREWAEGPEGEQDVLRYISATPALLSMLYDLDLLPEQHPDPESKEREQIFIITNHWREAQLARSEKEPQVVGRVWNDQGQGEARLNSVGRTLPDDTPLYAAPQEGAGSPAGPATDGEPAVAAFSSDKQETPRTEAFFTSAVGMNSGVFRQKAIEKMEELERELADMTDDYMRLLREKQDALDAGHLPSAREESPVTPEQFADLLKRIAVRMGGHTIPVIHGPAWHNFMGLLRQVTPYECGIGPMPRESNSPYVEVQSSKDEK